jgi:mitogen-activated protein kinase 15
LPPGKTFGKTSCTASHTNSVFTIFCRLLNVTKAENEKDIYLVFEYMETDLHAVLRANILEDIHKRYIMYQLFRSLKYLHSAQLLHRDVKVRPSSLPLHAVRLLHLFTDHVAVLQPSNLLLNCECLLKLADFGLARSLADLQGESMNNAQLTDYVATRWYRAPEILLGSHKYTFGVDMWSCGCILGELLTGRPIFPGKSTMNQLDLIFEVTGVPSPEEASRIGSPYCSQMLDVPGATSLPRRMLLGKEWVTCCCISKHCVQSVAAPQAPRPCELPDTTHLMADHHDGGCCMPV